MISSTFYQFTRRARSAMLGRVAAALIRTDDGQYVLYSIGWNEKDDNGVESRSAKGILDLDRGDWVWSLPRAF